LRRPGAALALVAAALCACSGPPHPPSGPASRAAAPRAPATASSSSSSSPSGPGHSAASPAPHVMVIMMENREASSVIGSPDAPYVNSLASRFGLATNSYGFTHPSLPNYLELISGSTHGINSDCTDCSVDGTTLVDQMAARGISWKAYMEGAPTPCYRADSSPEGYAKRHNPFVYFTHIADDPAMCGRIVPFSQLASDLASPDGPSFVWVTPDLCHDGHDCPTSDADSWLGRTLPSVLASPWYRAGGVVIITWDEGTSSASCCHGASGGRIPTLVVSASTPAGARSAQPVDHAGTLATIEDLYGLPHLGDAADPASGSLLALLPGRIPHPGPAG
jgi:hypothetical protein